MRTLKVAGSPQGPAPKGAALLWRVVQHVPRQICPAAQDESGLSGSLSLGHYGVSQSNAFESFAADPNGAEIVTPFAKLQVGCKNPAVCNFTAWCLS